MAVNIGPKIGIDGEADYRKAINNIIQQQKTLGAEMERTSAVFAKDADAKKKNAAQIEILNKQIATQKDRISQLSAMYDESVRKTGENSTASLKWKEALVAAETELAKMENQLSSMTGLDKFTKDLEESGKKLQDIGDGISKVGQDLTTKVTGPIMAAGAASVAALKDVDEGYDTIIKKTGATGEALESLQRSMESVATSVPVSFEKAGDAIGEVNTRFGLTGEELEDLSRQFLKFAELNSVDVTASIDSVQAAMAAFGVETDSAADILDILNKAGQDTGVSVDKLAQDLTTNSTALKELGFGMNTAIGFMANLNKNGIDSSAVMAGLKKALQNATKDGKTMGEAIDELTQSMANAQTDTEAMALATELFGAKAGPQLAAAIQEGRLSFDDFTNTVKDWGDSVTTTFEATQDPWDEWNMTLNELKLAGADLGTVLMDVLAPVISQVTEGVKGLRDWMNGLDEDEKKQIIQIAGIVAAVGPVITVIGTVISTVGTLMTVGSTLVAGIGTVIGILGGPLTVAIAAAVAAGVLLYQNWDKVREWAGTVSESVKTKFTEMKTNIETTFTNIKNSVTEKINAAKSAVQTAVDRIKSIMNFSWSLPHLKLPHISISGSFSLMPPSVPSFSIAWYKKAYQNAVMFNTPTVIPTASGLKGFGDGSGGEIVIGRETLLDTLTAAVQRAGASNNVTINMSIAADPSMDLEDLADAVSEKIMDQIQSVQEVFA